MSVEEKKNEEPIVWKKLGRVALIVSIIGGLLAIGNVFTKKTPTNQTNGNISPIIQSRDGDIDVQIGVGETQKDTLKSKEP